MISSASLGSLIFQIFIIWLISTIFSKKKKKNKGSIQTNFKKIFQNLGKQFEEKISELKIIPEDEKFEENQDLPLETSEPESIDKIINKKEEKLSTALKQALKTRRSKKRKKTSKLGLNSKSKLKNAIIINEIIGKPISLRKKGII